MIVNESSKIKAIKLSSKINNKKNTEVKHEMTITTKDRRDIGTMLFSYNKTRITNIIVSGKNNVFRKINNAAILLAFSNMSLTDETEISLSNILQGWTACISIRR